MSELMYLMLDFFAGMAMGALFFGGLWWTVQKGLVSSRPALWFMGSLLLRTGLTLCGFYFVAGSNWKSLAACLLGFIVARFIITRVSVSERDLCIKGADHAP